MSRSLGVFGAFAADYPESFRRPYAADIEILSQNGSMAHSALPSLHFGGTTLILIARRLPSRWATPKVNRVIN